MNVQAKGKKKSAGFASQPNHIAPKCIDKWARNFWWYRKKSCAYSSIGT